MEDNRRARQALVDSSTLCPSTSLGRETNVLFPLAFLFSRVASSIFCKDPRDGHFKHDIPVNSPRNLH